MKIEWVNQGKPFEIPKINVDMEIEILDYMDTLDKDMKTMKKNILEFRETVYRVLNSVDKNITKEMVTENLSTNELGALYVDIRTRGKARYVCPHCKKSFIYEEMPAEGDKNFRNNSVKDTTEMKKKF